MTIIVPEEVQAAEGDLLLDTESSLTIGGTGTGYSGTGGSAPSPAEKFTNLLESLNSADGSGLSAALGFGVTLTQDVTIGTATQQEEVTCPLGY